MRIISITFIRANDEIKRVPLEVILSNRSQSLEQHVQFSSPSSDTLRQESSKGLIAFENERTESKVKERWRLGSRNRWI